MKSTLLTAVLMTSSIFTSHLALAYEAFNLNAITNIFANDEFQDQNITEFGLSGSKKIVLTFDDGPGNGTERILDTLKKYNIKATFFALGQQLRKYPTTAKRIVNEGHVLANHSFQHDRLSKDIYKTNPAALFTDLMSTHKEIKKLTPDKNFYYFRAPYGAWSQGHADYLNQDAELRKYIGPIHWTTGGDINVDSTGAPTDAADWKCWGKSMPAFNDYKLCGTGYLNSMIRKNGGMVLFHDIHSKTADMIEYIIPILIQKGFQFIKIDEVDELKNYERKQLSEFFKERASYYRNFKEQQK